jgi:hypothetical protein
MCAMHPAFEGAGNEPGLFIWRIEVSFLFIVSRYEADIFDVVFFSLAPGKHLLIDWTAAV